MNNERFYKFFKKPAEQVGADNQAEDQEAVEGVDKKEGDLEDIDEQLEAAAEELQDKFKGLQQEIQDFGGEEKLTRAMRKADQGIVKNIIRRAETIALGLGMAVAVFGNLRSSLESGDYGHVAAVLITWAVVSVSASSLVELIKRS